MEYNGRTAVPPILHEILISQYRYKRQCVYSLYKGIDLGSWEKVRSREF